MELLHTVADDLDQACEDLTREWTDECRDRWIHDVDAPATPQDHVRPTLARRPTDRHRDRQTAPERSYLAVIAKQRQAQQAKVDEITHRLDALQHRRTGLGRGRGLS